MNSERANFLLRRRRRTPITNMFTQAISQKILNPPNDHELTSIFHVPPPTKATIHSFIHGRNTKHEQDTQKGKEKRGGWLMAYSVLKLVRFKKIENQKN